jgi:hypothetical protein
MHRLRLEGRISEAEFAERLEESKIELERLIATSRVTVETRKIIRARASILFPRLPKTIIQKQKVKKKEKEQKSK